MVCEAQGGPTLPVGGVGTEGSRAGRRPVAFGRSGGTFAGPACGFCSGPGLPRMSARGHERPRADAGRTTSRQSLKLFRSDPPTRGGRCRSRAEGRVQRSPHGDKFIAVCLMFISVLPWEAGGWVAPRRPARAAVYCARARTRGPEHGQGTIYRPARTYCGEGRLQRAPRTGGGARSVGRPTRSAESRARGREPGARTRRAGQGPSSWRAAFPALRIAYRSECFPDAPLAEGGREVTATPVLRRTPSGTSPTIWWPCWVRSNCQAARLCPACPTPTGQPVVGRS